MLRLSCIAQQYEWGKLGADSAVARLKSKGEGVAIAADKPYAEYWFGTHPSGPSRVITPDAGEMPLQDYLMSHPDALGPAPYAPDTALPYLFKVLSIAKALSVQAHPDKARAARLHALRPDVYKDGNHKPEMACALTPFEAMCSFRAPAEIAANVRAVPELRAMVGEALAGPLLSAADAAAAAAPTDGDAAEAFRGALREAYGAFMSQPESVVKEQTALLEARLRAEAAGAGAGAGAGSDSSSSLTAPAAALRLCAQFPGDVGVFSPFLLNTVSLRPGQAIFLGANEPHAYLSGDCVEVMACSDNVVRAGLTPKFKDVATLVEMLTYSSGAPAVLDGEPVDGCTRQYPAPVPEFLLQRTAVREADGDYTLPPVPSAAILVVVGGEGVATSTTAAAAAAAAAAGASSEGSGGGEKEEEVVVREGQVWLQPANVGLRLRATGGPGGEVLLFRSHANPGK